METADSATPHARDDGAIFLSIVVPAFNEQMRIARSLLRIRQYLATKTFTAEVIVVDDGSLDDTPRVVERAAREWPALRLVRNGGNRGKGFSVRHGMLEARGRFALFTDADLSAPIEQADALLVAVESVGADAAVGSRALQRELIGVHQGWVREWGGIFFNWAVRLLTGLRLHDTQCGLKLFRLETTRRAFKYLRAERYGFDPELLFLVQRLGGRVLEIPVRWDNDPASKFRVCRDAGRWLLVVAAVRWRARTGQYPPSRPAGEGAPSREERGQAPA